jgi:hypothetical protein
VRPSPKLYKVGKVLPFGVSSQDSIRVAIKKLLINAYLRNGKMLKTFRVINGIFSLAYIFMPKNTQYSLKKLQVGTKPVKYSHQFV